MIEDFWQGMLFAGNIIFSLIALIWIGRWLRMSGQIREQFLQDIVSLRNSRFIIFQYFEKPRKSDVAMAFSGGRLFGYLFAVFGQ